MKPKAIQEAKPILLVVILLLLGSLRVWRPLAWFWGGVLGFVFYFFRDPERTPPDDPSIAVAPADGRIVGIDEREEGEVLEERMLCISIFLSVLDVHVNRSPIAGRVTHSEERKGLYLDARNPDSSTRNACRLWIFENGPLRVAVRQITGAIARRIVPWAKVGETVAQGEKFGMIRFGSRTELFVPLGSTPLVRLGDKVQGGLTPLARVAAAESGPTVER